MKKLAILLIVICSVASCGKEEMFSCNPEVDLWVKSNITEIQQMERADFISIGVLDYQRAAYNAFTPNQRQALWIGKMEEVLKLDWSKQERLHIQSMLELIKSYSVAFSNNRDQDAFDKVKVEIYKWTEYAQEELGWNNSLLYSLIATPQVINANKEIKSDLATPVRLKSGSESCDCNSTSSAGHLPCNYLMYQCHTGICDQTSWGCGDWWGDGCNGICKSR